MAGLDAIESRLTSLEDKIDQWLDLEGGMPAKNVLERLRGPGLVGQDNGRLESKPAP